MSQSRIQPHNPILSCSRSANFSRHWQPGRIVLRIVLSDLNAFRDNKQPLLMTSTFLCGRTLCLQRPGMLRFVRLSDFWSGPTFSISWAHSRVNKTQAVINCVSPASFPHHLCSSAHCPLLVALTPISHLRGCSQLI